MLLLLLLLPFVFLGSVSAQINYFNVDGGWAGNDANGNAIIKWEIIVCVTGETSGITVRVPTISGTGAGTANVVSDEDSPWGQGCNANTWRGDVVGRARDKMMPSDPGSQNDEVTPADGITIEADGCGTLSWVTYSKDYDSDGRDEDHYVVANVVSNADGQGADPGFNCTGEDANGNQGCESRSPTGPMASRSECVNRVDCDDVSTNNYEQILGLAHEFIDTIRSDDGLSMEIIFAYVACHHGESDYVAGFDLVEPGNNGFVDITPDTIVGIQIQTNEWFTFGAEGARFDYSLILDSIRLENPGIQYLQAATDFAPFGRTIVHTDETNDQLLTNPTTSYLPMDASQNNQNGIDDTACGSFELQCDTIYLHSFYTFEFSAPSGEQCNDFTRIVANASGYSPKNGYQSTGDDDGIDEGAPREQSTVGLQPDPEFGDCTATITTTCSAAPGEDCSRFDLMICATPPPSCTNPTNITFSQNAATCANATSNNNGTISLTAHTGGTHYGVSTLNAVNYDGATTIALATSIGSLLATLQSNIPNAGGNYTIRIFNTNETCFTDNIITVAEVECSVACDPSLVGSVVYDGCQGDTYSVMVGSITYDESNPIGTQTLTTASGCDSVVTINLVYKPNATGTETYTGTQGDGYSVTVNGTPYDENNPTGTQTITSANGCDSVVMINLVYNVSTCDVTIAANSLSSCIGGIFDGTITLDWMDAPTTGNIEYSVNGGAYQALSPTRSNMSANATGEAIILPNLTCNTTKKITLRFADAPTCTEELIFVFAPGDPAGHIYCEETGAIITGGTISVTPPAGGSVSIGMNGANGHYYWLATGSPVTAGIYTMSYNPPAGFTNSGIAGVRTGDTDDIMDPTSTSEDNPTSQDPLLLGADTINGGNTLSNFTAASNPFFLVFDIEENDPFVDLNNLPLAGCIDCGIDISQSTSGCTDNNNGTFTSNLNVQVIWKGAPDPAEDIVLTINGISQNITTIPGSVDTAIVQLIIPADGTLNEIFAHFATNIACGDTLTFKAPVPCVADVTLDCSNVISGTTFQDFNFDGTNNDNGGGIAGVKVFAYDCDNVLKDSTWTDVDGEYQLMNTIAGTEYRIEFELPEAVSCWAKPTQGGTNNLSTIQFAQVGACVNLGIASPADYCQTNPNVFTPCYIAGDPYSGNALYNSLDAFVGFPYESNNSTKAGLIPMIPPVDIGATWGVAYQRATKAVFTSAVLKRHAGFGAITGTTPTTGGIYALDISTSVANPTLIKWIDLNTIGINTGANPRDGSTANSLANNPTSPSYDAAAYEKIGKVGIGDIDLQDDQTLWLINLNDRSLYGIKNADPNTTPTAADVLGPFALPNTGCGSGEEDVRPWALEIYKGKIYIGAVCSGESSQNDAAIHAYIFEFDPISQRMASFFDFDLNYDRGNAGVGSPPTDVGDWQAWQLAANFPLNNRYNQQPILADIEFDLDGSMIIGMMDRWGLQVHDNNFIPDPAGISVANTATVFIALGDVLRVCNDNGNFVFEGGAGCAYPATNTNVTASEYYQGDYGEDGQYLKETAFGSLLYLPGDDEVMITQFDPFLAFNEGGIRTLNNTTGDLNRRYLIYADANIGDAAKAVGLGDIVAQCDPAPIEIGNYVWNDENKNGIQDACEPALDSIVVRLYDDNCNLIGLDTTLNNGQYAFNQHNVDTTGVSATGVPTTGLSGLSPNTTYYVVLGKDGEWNNTDNQLVIGEDIYELTLANQGSNEEIDNDATAGTACGLTNTAPFIEVQTASAGCMIHNADFGLLAGLSLGNLVWEDLNNNGMVDAGEPGIDSVELQLYSVGPNGLKDSGDDDILIDSTLTDAMGNYKFTALDSGTYYVKITGGIPTNMVSSTGTGADGIGTSTFEPFTGTDSNVNNDDDGTQMLMADGTLMIMSDTIQLKKMDEPIDDDDTNNNSNLTVDFGLIRLLSVGNLVWEDANNDGLNNNSEVGIDGITVYLLDDGDDNTKGNNDDNILDSVITATGGQYLFDSLYPGEYYIKLNSGIPAGMVSSTAKENTALDTEPAADPDTDATNDDDNGTQMGTMVMSELVALILSEEPIDDGDVDSTSNLSVDFGLFTPLSLGNLVWEDLDNDGQAETGELGIEDVELILYAVGPNGVKDGGIGDDIEIARDTTDATGSYVFDTLTTGTYFVKINSGIPIGMYSATGTGEDGTSASTYEPFTGTDLNANNDDDGTQMGTMIMSDTVLLVKNTEPTNDDDADNNTNFSVDFGLIRYLSIGNLVWIDSDNDGLFNNGETGLDGIKTLLYKDGGDGTKGAGDDVLIDSILTAGGGLYEFDSLAPGQYFVKLKDLNPGLISSTGEGITTITGVGTYEPATDPDATDTDSDDSGSQMGYGDTAMVVSDLVSLTLSDEPTSEDADSTSNLTVDFGLIQTLQIGNLVWEDLDNDGMAETGEPGMEDVELILYTVGNDGEKDGGDDVEIKRDTTDANGNYLFDFLTEGTYYVKINSGTPADMVSSTGTGAAGTSASTFEPSTSTINDTNSDDDGTQMINGGALMVMSDTINLAIDAEPINDEDTDNNTNLSVDFGLIRFLSIGNLVWEDTDNDGLNNNGETGIDGVEVMLFQAGADNIKGTSDDVILDSMLTANGGLYEFDSLYPGDYYIKLNDGIPTGMHSSTGEGTGIFTGIGSAEPANDPDATDTNDDDSGTQMDLMVISDLVTLNLSDESTTDGDADTTSNLAVDFGLYQTISVGNLVWEDLDNDGQFDDGTEMGIDSVEVQIYNIGSDGEKGTGDDTLVQTDTTDANGNYNFTFLGQGTYFVKLSEGIPTGYISANGAGTTGTNTPTFEPGATTDGDTDNDDDGTQMGTMIMSDTFQLVKDMEPINDSDLDSNTNFSIDFGLIPSMSLGNLVWEDLDNDGIAEIGERGIDGITVYLMDDGADNTKGNVDDTVLDSIITAAGGQYLFDTIYPGEYYVKLNSGIPTDLISSTGEGDSISIGTGTYETAPDVDVVEADNDDNGNQMGTMVMSDLILMELYKEPVNDGDVDSTTNYGVDFGLFHTLTLGNLAWEDTNHDGLNNNGEQGIDSIEVVLYTVGPDGVKGGSDDVVIATDTTDTNGNYLFEDLYPNEYYVQLNDIPTGMISSTAKENAALDTEPGIDADGDETDNDDNGTQMGAMVMSELVQLSLGEEPITDTDTDSTTNLSVDFGLFVPLSIGNLVWEDLNNNGRADAGEPGIDSIELILFAVGTDGVKGGEDDIQIAIDTTDASGNYLFDTLIAGTYYVKINSGIPANMYSSTGTGFDGSQAVTYEPSTVMDNNTDSDDDGTQMITNGQLMVMSDTINLFKFTESTTDEDIDNRSNTTVDFGLIRLLSIGNLVWEDSDNDGQFNNGEVGIDSIEVILYQAGADSTKGTVDDIGIDTMLTLADGSYLFDTLYPGEYFVKLNSGLLPGMISSTGEGTPVINGTGTYEPGVNADTDETNNDDNGTQMGSRASTMVMSDIVLLSLSDEPTNDGDVDSTSNLTVDFGILQTMSIGNLVWEDLDNSGTADAGEPGIDSVELVLFELGDDGLKGTNDDIEIKRDTTDANGNYLFEYITQGTYFVKINSGTPTDMYSSTGTGTDGTTANTFEPFTGTDSNVDDNDDGTQMIVNSQLMVLSDTFQIKSYTEPKDDSDTDDNTNLSVDFGLIRLLSIGNLVWEDNDNDGLYNNGETGIDGIEVLLISDGGDGIKGNVNDTILESMLTANGGQYLFDSLYPGDYFIKLNDGIPAGMHSSTGEGTGVFTGSGIAEPAADPDNTDTNDDDSGTQMGTPTMRMVMSELVTLSLSDEPTNDGDIDTTSNLAVDFGLYQTISVGNLVWEDLDNDGNFDSGTESGIDSVEVEIYNIGSDGIKGTVDDQLVQTDTTDANGNYNFTFLGKGTYFVKLSDGIPTGYVSANGVGTMGTEAPTFEPGAKTNADTDNDDDGTQMDMMVMSNTFQLVKNMEPVDDSDLDSNTNFSVDFGLIPSMELGNLVWEDLNNNGIVDAGEPGIDGVEVLLLTAGADGIKGNADDIALDSMLTTGGGQYLFDTIYPGEYYLKLNDGIPTDLISSSGEGDSIAFGTGTYETAPDPDDAEVNNDDNGTQIGATVMSDLVLMELYNEPTNDDDTDNTTNFNVDFGLYHTLMIGNLVWEDLNNNGLFDSGTESGMDSVEVVLYQPGADGIKGNADDVLVAKDTTDVNGNYLFEDLYPNNYYLVLASGIPANMVSSSGEGDMVGDGTGTYEIAPDPDTNINNDDDGTGMQVGSNMLVMSDILSLGLYDEPTTDGDIDSTTNLSVDFGLYQTLSIGNLVWEDLNNDGVADANESKMKDIIITLFKDGGDGIKMSADDINMGNETTDINGNYLFDNLYPGDYYLKINDLPFGMISSTGEGINSTSNSGTYEPAPDADINTDNLDDGIFMDSMIMSTMLSLHLYDEPINDGDTENVTNLSVDFGLFQTLILGNLVWEDLNNNGIVDTDEPGMEDVEVILYRDYDGTKGGNDDVEIGRDTTDADGQYLFLNLDAGMYYVKLNSGIPAGFMSSTGEGTALITGSGAYEPAPDADVYVDGDDNGTQMTMPDGSIMVMSELISMILYHEQVDSVVNVDVDFGLYNTLEAGNLVWEDRNNNGLVDAGEPGIQGVEVILYQTTNGTKGDVDDVEIGRDTTDSMGLYLFQTLEPGDYWVKLNSGIPTGFYSSTGEGINTVTGTGTFEPSSMVDDNIDDNDDGTQMGLGDNIMIMSDIVSLDLYDEPDSTTIRDSSANYRIDFGLYETIDLGNLVWEDYDNDGVKDADEPGFPNIEVVLSQPGPDGLTCTADDIIVRKDTTDVNGAYLFEYLYPNEYFITLNDIPDGFYSSSGEGFMEAEGTGTNEPAADADDDTDGDDDGTEAYLADGTRIVKSDLFNLSLYEETTNDTDTDSTTNLAVDFGLYESLEIGNLVWEDLDNDGIVDIGEPGFDSVEVILYKAGPDDQKGTGDDIEIGRDTTDSNGTYEFVDLYPGDYFVKLNSGIPAHFASSTGEGTVLADGSGTFEPAADPNGNIDANDDGTQMGNPDGSLMVMSDLVSLHLYDEPTNDGDIDSTTNFDIDFGLFELLALGNCVWEDLNNNGLIDTTNESGIAGIETILFKDGGDGITGSVDDIEIERMMTDSAGKYRFDDLYPGDYFVQLASGIPYNMVSSTGEGINLVTGTGTYEIAPDSDNDLDNDDSGNQTGRTITSGLVSLELYTEPINDGDINTATNLAVDFGLITKIDVGGEVWFDRTNDGIIDPIGEYPLEDIEVILFKPGTDGIVGTVDDIPVDTTTTDVNGDYLFPFLFPDAYYIVLNDIPSWLASSDGNGFGAYTGTGSLEPGFDPDNHIDGDDNGLQVGTTRIICEVIDLVLYDEPIDDVDTLNYTNTTVDFGLTALHFARIFDPCNCLSNESAPGAGDGQFDETITILSTIENQTWSLVSNTNMYTTSNVLVPLGTVAIPNGKEGGYFKYGLKIRHYDAQGYTATFASNNGALTISNFCRYEESCRYTLVTSPDGTPGVAQLALAQNFIMGVTNTPKSDTLLSCDNDSDFMDGGLVDGLYIDTTARDNQYTICPQTPWQYIQANFTQFGLAAGDVLFVHDGKDISTPQIGRYEGVGVSQTGGWVAAHCDPDTNATGCLTFRFVTNGDNNKGIGWHADISCNERNIQLTPPNNLNAKLECDSTYAIFAIKPATVMASCGTVQDSQIVRVFNQHGVVCLDTCLAITDVVRDTFAIGSYLVEYKLKSDTVKTAQAVMTVQGATLVCNDEVNVPLGSACGLMLTPDDLLESTCDTIIDTLYYHITLKGKDKNGNEVVLATGGGKGGNYPIVTKDMIDQCGGSITAEIEKRYYEGLKLSICNNGVKNISCVVKVNIFDQSPPIFQNVTSNDTFRLCNVDLTADALGIAAPTAIDNCDTVKVEFTGATVLNDGGACDTTRAMLNWTATDACGNVATLAQSVVILRPDATDIVQAPDVILSCGEDEAPIAIGVNDFAKTGMPRIKVGKVMNGVLVPTDTIALDTASYVCGYILQKREVRVPADCGIKVFRYWDLLDWCAASTGIIPIDTQYIELRDTLAPKFVATALPTLNLALPHDACTLDITKLAIPAATDNCSTPSVSMTQVFRIENGMKWVIPVAELTALSCDSFEVHWVASDDCHVQIKTATLTQLVIIEDNTKPAAICTDKINLSLGQAAAKLHYREIDGGSNDACGIAKYEVSRDEVNWDSVVTFTCEDAHQKTKVYLRVTDAKGNHNTCWMIVNVEDKIAPICSDLPDMTETCDEGHGNGLLATDTNENGQMEENEWVDLTKEQAADFNTKYGNPDCSDNVNCGALVIQQQYQLLEKTCGQATIKRRFRAIDWDGEGRTSNWSVQTINIETKADWSITVPTDWKGKCGETVPNSELIIKNGACDLMAYEVEEKVYSPSGAGGEDACLKVVRTFTIINWCKYEAGGETKTITRVENEHGMVTEGSTITSEGYENVGKLEYIQILKLKDETAPVITFENVDDCIENENCQQMKRFAITATDCNETATATLNYSWTISAGDTELGNGTGAEFDYSIATSIKYEVEWKVADNCGNTAVEKATYQFVDCKKPAPYCLHGVAVELMPEVGMIQIWATDLDAGSSDNCTAKDRLTFKIWHESLGDAPTHIASILALPENITFNCAYLGNQAVNVYVIDEANNWDFCVTYVNVQDNMGACENADAERMAIVSGTIMDWKAQTVEEVQVHVSNSGSMMTQADGHYDFELAMNEAYQIAPTKDHFPLNGVSTFDLVLMAKHILGVQAFENPYQMIAADVNQSGTITAFDMVQIRRLILNINTEFANSQSWRFVDAAYEFSTDNPIAEDFPEIIRIADLKEDMEMDFVAIKIGDVNGNANPNGFGQATDRTTEKAFEITTEDQIMKSGETYTVIFNTDQLATIQGYQFTLTYDDLKVKKLKSGVVGVENFGLHKMDKGMITTSWNQSPVADGNTTTSQHSNKATPQHGNIATNLFTIEFTAEKDGKLSEQLSILSRPTAIEAYDENGDLMEVKLTFTTPKLADEFELFQNQPNPFHDKTIIGFYLSGDSEVQLILRDETGRILKTVKENRKAGHNAIQFNKEELTNGFIYYQLSTKFGTKAKKMLKLK